jgi:lipopolysaccharide export system ATP-binding protein
VRLSTEAVSKAYAKRFVVKDVTLEVNSGEIVGLLGPNGAGKTTTFYMIVGMLNPDEGDISIDSESINKLPMYKRARKGIGYLPQEPSIFRRLTVRENLIAVLELTGLYNSRDALMGRVDEIIEEFNLGAFADRDGYRLSGGERRRAEIARAISLNPRFMLFDEPFAGIDPIAISDLKRILMYLKSKGIGILITDHNVRETLSITDRSYIISDGTVIAQGSSEDIINDDSVRSAYLGEGFRL